MAVGPPATGVTWQYPNHPGSFASDGANSVAGVPGRIPTGGSASTPSRLDNKNDKGNKKGACPLLFGTLVAASARLCPLPVSAFEQEAPLGNFPFPCPPSCFGGALRSGSF